MGQEQHRCGRRSGGGQSAKKSEHEKHPLTRNGRVGLDTRQMVIRAPMALRKRICQDTKKMSEGSTHSEKGGKGEGVLVRQPKMRTWTVSNPVMRYQGGLLFDKGRRRK